MRRRKRKYKNTWMLLGAAWMAVCLGAGGLLALYLPSAAEAEVPLAEPVLTEVETEALAMLLPESKPLSVESVSFSSGVSLRGNLPKILIYHTHTTEAYLPTERFAYTESSRWRTNDSSRSVVAVGALLKELLETKYGFCVLHDTTDHEPPKLSSAYERSEQTMLRYKEQYPSLELFIDLHRDAFGKESTTPVDFITVDGEETARIMFVVGQGEKYTDKPYFDNNYRTAERVTSYLNAIHSKFARPIRVKTGRYNQHIAPNSLLIEIGHNANTLEQALHAVPYVAEGIELAFAEAKNESPDWVPMPVRN